MNIEIDPKDLCATEVCRWKTLDEIVDGISADSPILERIRQNERQRQTLIVWQIIAVMGWLSFLAVVIVAGMR